MNLTKNPLNWENPRPRRPTLRMTPTAWAKLLFLRDLGETEIGAFGIAQTNEILLVTDIQLVNQICTVASVEFDDAAVAAFFDKKVDRGLHPAQFGRVWIHTHPGNSARPSCVDEDTFARAFGRADWAVMFILARGGQTYARLQFQAGPGGALRIPVQIDYGQPFAASDYAAWDAEYQAKVTPESMLLTSRSVILDRGAADPIIATESQVHDRIFADFRDDSFFVEGSFYGCS